MTPDPLSPRAQALLDAARDGLGPDDAAIARMRDKVLAGAGGIGVAAGTAKAGMSFAAKLSLVAVAGALAIGGGVWWATRDTAPDRSRERANAIAAVSTDRDMGAHGRQMAARLQDPEVQHMIAEQQAEVARRASAAVVPEPVAANQVAKEPARKTHAGVASGSAPAKAKAPSLADEVALVDDAMAALRHDDPRAALAAADDHVARFGRRGQLAEEASAIRVESLCRLGDARWSSALDAFDEHWPRSAQRPRLTAACKGVQ